MHSIVVPHQMVPLEVVFTWQSSDFHNLTVGEAMQVMEREIIINHKLYDDITLRGVVNPIDADSKLCGLNGLHEKHLVCKMLTNGHHRVHATWRNGRKVIPVAI